MNIVSGLRRFYIMNNHVIFIISHFLYFYIRISTRPIGFMYTLLIILYTYIQKYDTEKVKSVEKEFH